MQLEQPKIIWSTSIANFSSAAEL